MATRIVVTGLEQLSAAGRWPRLVAPLAEELARSGLGELPDIEALRREFEESGKLEATEVAVELGRFDYGRQLVDRVTMETGIARDPSVIPAQWQEYHCDDYFESPLTEHGHWDERGQYWYVWPSERVYEDTDLKFLAIGGPGVDGIHWGYRRAHSGLWAWFPMRGEFARMAGTVKELLQGWISGAIVV